MHGGSRAWLAVLLATFMTCAVPVTAQAVDNGGFMLADDPAYESAYQTQPAMGSTHLVSNSSFVDEKPDAEARLAAIEAELKKMKDKAAAAKKKAAGKPNVKAGGRIYIDGARYAQGAASQAVYGDTQDGVEFRRARMFIQGKDCFHVIDYKFQLDFADADRVNPDFKDAYITVKHLPILGHVKMGHFKERFGLEELTSSRFITFMERSMVVESFSPGRNMGVCAYDTYLDERGTWAIGAFTSECGDDPPIRRDDDGGIALTGRATFLPWYDEGSGGRGLFHTGIAYSYRNIDDGTVRHRSRPNSHLANRVINTGQITLVPEEQMLGVEAAFVYGPFSVQTEHYSNWVTRTGVGTGYLNGYYVYASYFLTGEHRRYKRSGGEFDRIKPFTNFFRVRTCDGVETGWGAWELAYRYDSVNLVDTGVGIDGGFADGHSFGVNWYLNPYTRMMFNYCLTTSTNSVSGFGPVAGANPVTDMGAFQVRAQIDF